MQKAFDEVFAGDDLDVGDVVFPSEGNHLDSDAIGDPNGEVHLEIATLEGIGGIGNLLAQIPVSRVLFGSKAPLFYFESALLKLKETPLTDVQLDSIARANARRLIATQP